MRNKFLLSSWPYLKSLYGEKVFEENEFFVEDIYFQKWVSPIEEGYRIDMLLLLQKPPIYLLKNWDNSNIARIRLAFDGDFGLGHFPIRNRKLLKLQGKNIRFNFELNPKEIYPLIQVIADGSVFSFRTKRLAIISVIRLP